MKSSYIKALETQAQWFEWGCQHKVSPRTAKDPGFENALISYTAVLQNAETIFMNSHFCDLVDYARLTVPDELMFEEEWMFTPIGFLYLEEPFAVPDPQLDKSYWEDDIRELTEAMVGKMRVAAVSWVRLADGSYYFMCYQNRADYDRGHVGFMPWSHFVVRPGDKVLERLTAFEKTFEEGAYAMDTYPANRDMQLRHEIRWVFTALHMMSQRIAQFSRERASSLVRDMMRRKKLKINPDLRIVSLRRIRQEHTGESHPVDWQCQWVVRGHWRLQPYKTEGDYKWIFITAYVKGPEDKPLKPFGRTIFKAVR